MPGASRGGGQANHEAIRHMTVVILRAQGQLLTMGHHLRPVGGWSAAFRGAQWLSRPRVAWFTVWFGETLLALVQN